MTEQTENTGQVGQKQSLRDRWMLALELVLLVAVFLWLGLDQMRPPRPLGGDAAETEFSAARALRHVQALYETFPRMATTARQAAQLVYRPPVVLA